jgi:hypothetical protein
MRVLADVINDGVWIAMPYSNSLMERLPWKPANYTPASERGARR